MLGNEGSSPSILSPFNCSGSCPTQIQVVFFVPWVTPLLLSTFAGCINYLGPSLGKD